MELRPEPREKSSVFEESLMRRISGSSGAHTLSKAAFIEKVRESNAACQRGDFAAGVQLYTEAITADPQNCILYSNRSAVLVRLQDYQAALEDALTACHLNPKWAKIIG
uniref:Tetratricopeptide repeat protein 28 n=1 Tax=Callorhinchus milii TaxID=7868 RepID=V9L900_CALMI